MLFKVSAVKHIALCLAIIFGLHVIVPPALLADSFTSSLGEGNSLAGSLINQHTPANIDLNATIPDYDNVQAQSGTYSSYYTSPGSMSSAASGEGLDFVQESYASRRQYDLSSDPTFGNKCLARDGEGRCTRWSLSSDLVTNTYPDCTRVVVPEYETSNFQTCSNTVTYNITPECAIKKYLDTRIEYVDGPCSSIESLGVQDDQIYALCKDNFELYRVNKGSVSAARPYEAVRAGMCNQIGGCDCYITCPADAVTVSDESQLPEGAEYFFQGVAGMSCGDDICTSTWYQYYKLTRPSTVERLFIRSDRTCSREALDQWESNEGCVIWDYAKCDQSGLNCIYYIQNGVETGNTASEECQTYPSAMYGHGTVMYDTEGYNDCLSGCPYTYSGSNCVETNPDYQYQVCDGFDCRMTFPSCTSCETCASCGTNCSGCTNCTGCYPGGSLPGGDTMICQSGGIVYEASCQQACATASSLALDNYNVCLPDDGLSGVTLNTKPLTTTPSTTIAFYTTQSVFWLSWLAQFGGPGVEQNVNNWYTKIRFKCREEANTCDSLIEQGCTLHNQRCLDDDCTQVEYTYQCGDSRITGYRVAYNCAGELRCIGTDCTDTLEYDANRELAAVATAGEVLNMARVDSTKSGGNIRIFPGVAMECQSAPENCCRPTTGGLSIGDYISAGKTAIDIYGYASQGFSGMATGYANTITNVGNYLAGQTGLAASTTATVEAGGIATTTTTISSGLGVSTTTTTMAGAEMSVSATIAAPTGAISAVGTVMAGVGIIMAAYTIATMVYNMMFACTSEDLETSIKVGFHLCHYVDTREADRAFGFITQKWKRYCCFNSILARIIHEQGRPQLGIGWGGGVSSTALDCRGFSTQELSSLDFSRIDLSEYIRHIGYKTEMSPADVERIRNNLAGYTPPAP